MAKILLIFPPAYYMIKGAAIGPSNQYMSAVFPPLGLLYLARILMNHGHRVTLLDLSAQTVSTEEFKSLLHSHDLAGISAQSFHLEQVKELVTFIREARPELPLIGGGPHFKTTQQFLDGFDAVSYTYGENLIVPLVKTLLRKNSLPVHLLDEELANIPGILFRKQDGSLCKTDPPELTNLEDLPLPAWEIINPDHYSLLGKVNRKFANIITSRGCPFTCRFCAREHHYQARSVESILAEMEYHVANGRTKFIFADDLFLVSKQRVKKLCEELIQRKWGITFLFQAHANSGDEELYRLLKKAGARAVVFGLESFTQPVLDFLGKKTTVEQNKQAVLDAHKAGLVVFSFFIIGSPPETPELMQQTFRTIRSLPIDALTFYPLDYPYGSTLWKEACDAGLIQPDEMIVPATRERNLGLYSKEELEDIASREFDRFYKNPFRWLRILRKMILLNDRDDYRAMYRLIVRLFRNSME